MHKFRIPDNRLNPGDEGLRLESPWMAPTAIDFLNRVLTQDMVILDIATGASTLFYARRCKFVTGVETDGEWAQKVKDTLYAHGLDSCFSMHHVSDKPDLIDAAIRTLPDHTYDVVSVDTVHGYDRDRFLDAAITKLKRGGMVVLDNWADGILFPKYSLYSEQQLLDSLGLSDRSGFRGYAALDFYEPHWVGNGTRILVQKEQ